jgi:hypothetical protein
MKWTSRILLASIIFTAGCLCLVYGLGKLWTAIPLFVAVGGIGLWGITRRKGALTFLSLFFLFIGSFSGLYFFQYSGLMLANMIAIIAAWDLEHFTRRVRTVQRVEEVHTLEKIHLARLGMVLGTGAVLGIASLLVRVKFSFGIAFVLGLLAVFGLSRTIIFLKRSSD